MVQIRQAMQAKDSSLADAGRYLIHHLSVLLHGQQTCEPAAISYC